MRNAQNVLWKDSLQLLVALSLTAEQWEVKIVVIKEDNIMNEVYVSFSDSEGDHYVVPLRYLYVRIVDGEYQAGQAIGGDAVEIEEEVYKSLFSVIRQHNTVISI